MSSAITWRASRVSATTTHTQRALPPVTSCSEIFSATARTGSPRYSVS